MDTQTLLIVALIAAVAVLAVVVLRRPQGTPANDQAVQTVIGRAMAEQRETLARSVTEALRALQESNEARLQTADKQVADQVESVRRALTDLQKQTGEWDEKRATQISKLEEATGATKEAVDRLNTETASLSGAMKGSQTRGKWGEISLRKIVEACGMKEHVDFVEQRQETGEGDGRPDVTVNLPGGRVVYIDSKVPWDNYQRMLNATDEAQRTEFLRLHERDVRAHIDTLAKRTYTSSATSLDYLIMYVPVEPALAVALEQNPDLLDYATKRGVVLTSPLSLIVTLNNFHKSWDDESKVRNVATIVDATEELMKRVTDMVGHMAKVGDGLRKAVGDYNKSVGSYNSRVVPQAGKVSDLRQKDLSMPELDEVPAELRDFKTAAWEQSSTADSGITLDIDETASDSSDD